MIIKEKNILSDGILEEISNFIYSNIINQLPKILKISMTKIIMNIEQKLANFAFC